MKQRIISALIAIPIFAWVMLGAPWWVFAAAWWLIISTVAYEWSRLILIRPTAQGRFIRIVAVLILCPLFGLGRENDFWLIILAVFGFVTIGAALLWLFLVPVMLKIYAKTGDIIGDEPLLYVLGIIFLTSFASAVAFLNWLFSGKWILGFLILIWLSDAGAYFIGKAIGKTKFSPQISPNKTWEGFLGGLLLALVGMLITLYFIDGYRHGEFVHFDIEMTVCAAVVGVISLIYASLGDLFESMLKRDAGVKDSGNIMLGHGGAYDRIDSWIPALTIAAAAAMLILF